MKKSGNPILLVIARFSSENRGNPEKKVKNFQKKIKFRVDTFFNKVYIHIHRRTTQQRRSFLTKQGRKEAIEQVRFY